MMKTILILSLALLLMSFSIDRRIGTVKLISNDFGYVMDSETNEVFYFDEKVEGLMECDEVSFLIKKTKRHGSMAYDLKKITIEPLKEQTMNQPSDLILLIEQELNSFPSKHKFEEIYSDKINNKNHFEVKYL